VLGFFVNATGRSDLAADLTAETVARALEAVAAFDPTRGRADQWVFGIARNVHAESYRRRRVEASARVRLGMPELILDDYTAETIARLSSGHGDASLALASLPNEQRQAIEARVLDERAYPDIAHELRLLRGAGAPASQPRPSSRPHTTGRWTMTILPQLERDLFNAAEERLRPDARAPDRRSGSPPSSFRAQLGQAAASLSLLVSVAVAIAIAVVAVALLGHGHHASQSTSASGPSRGSTRAELIRTLGVLRRPQTKADLDGIGRIDRELKARPKQMGSILEQWGYPNLDRRLARVVNIPAWRAKVLIAPTRFRPSPTSGQRDPNVSSLRGGLEPRSRCRGALSRADSREVRASARCSPTVSRLAASCPDCTIWTVWCADRT
jgi:DNA-directed RNA polymerase specialized sigma24 family protein